MCVGGGLGLSVCVCMSGLWALHTETGTCKGLRYPRIPNALLAIQLLSSLYILLTAFSVHSMTLCCLSLVVSTDSACKVCNKESEWKKT